MSVNLPNILYAIPRNVFTALGLPVAVGMLSGYQSQTRKGVDDTWYKSLAVPPGRPPAPVFPVVWTTLYAFMGFASHIAVKALDTAIVPATRCAPYIMLAIVSDWPIMQLRPQPGHEALLRPTWPQLSMEPPLFWCQAGLSAADVA
ncbi:hypothetical protein HWV62_24055 [Athelia sp. TMB]|nr:hypothetical protein HWV62_24055 [Athelia sp. TMB]